MIIQNLTSHSCALHLLSTDTSIIVLLCISCYGSSRGSSRGSCLMGPTFPCDQFFTHTMMHVPAMQPIGTHDLRVSKFSVLRKRSFLSCISLVDQSYGYLHPLLSVAETGTNDLYRPPYLCVSNNGGIRTLCCPHTCTRSCCFVELYQLYSVIHHSSPLASRIVLFSFPFGAVSTHPHKTVDR